MVKRTPVPKEFQAPTDTASEPQLNYLRKLRAGKDLSKLSQDQIEWLLQADFDMFPSMLDKKRMGDVIEQLVALPWKPRQQSHLPGDNAGYVPDGRYAVEKEDGTLMFYSVKQGKYKMFVDVWASDARWPVKNPSEVGRILKAIKADPDAGPRFGREIGRCYVCGRTLTDETSRALGIGPICREA